MARKFIHLTAVDIQGVGWFTSLGSAYVCLESTSAKYEELAGLGMAVVDLDIGEKLNGYILVPYDLNPNEEIGFRIIFTRDANWLKAFSSTQWSLNVDTITDNDEIIIPSKKLFTPIGPTIQKSSTKLRLNISPRGFNRDLARTIVEVQSGILMTFNILLQATSESGTAAIGYMGMIMDYDAIT